MLFCESETQQVLGLSRRPESISKRRNQEVQGRLSAPTAEWQLIQT
jgi:hypothetical protein